MRKFIFVCLVIGAALLLGLKYFSPSDISDIDKNRYNNALKLENTVENKVWKNFKVGKYPLAMRKGNNEYVFYNGDIKKRKAALDVYACTALEVDGKINIFMLPYEDIDSMMNPTGTFISQSNENHYIATIFHEGFHAYQWDNFKEVFQQDFLISDIEAANLLETVNTELYDEINSVLDKIDNEESIKTMYENEMKILYNGINEIDEFKKLEFAKKYIDQREKRNEILKERLDSREFEVLMLAEKHYELLEGTAHYIEIKTIELLKDKDRYEKLLDSLNYYHRNNIKYYKTGMGICILLDDLDSSWKDSVFKDKKSLFEKLSDAIGR